jgi:glutamine amidotransferase
MNNKSNLVIIDYGMGNIESILNAFRRLNENCIVSDNAKIISQASGIILPGVGAFHAAMHNLHTLGFTDLLNEQVLHHKKPFLGICLGMQLIAEDSVESQYSKGLGWIKAHILKIETAPHYPVPHVGWNDVKYTKENTLFSGIEDKGNFFFDHSYHFVCEPEWVIATCDYNSPRVAGIQKDNIFAVQFHPEKSQRNGAKLLRNFLTIVDATQ